MIELAERRGQWVHGYDLLRATGLKSGTLYPLLMRLHDRGYLEARWITAKADRRPRHAYRLTAKGAAAASAIAASAAAMRGGGPAVSAT
jgi:DNA-binding PadR family transcriptional regulator